MSIDKSFQQSLNKPLSQQLKHFNAQAIAQSQSSSLLSSPFFGGDIKQQPKKQSLSRPVTLNKRTIKKEVSSQIQKWRSSQFLASQFQIQNVQSNYFSTLYELMGQIYEILLNKFVQILKQKQRQFEQQPIKQYIDKVQYLILVIKGTQLNINSDQTFHNLYSNIVFSGKIIADCLHSQLTNKNNNKSILTNTLLSGTKAQIALQIKGKLAMLADQTFYYKNKMNIESESNLQASLYKQHDQDSNFSVYSDRSFSKSLAKQKKIKKLYSDTKFKKLLSNNHVSLMKKRLDRIQNEQIKNVLVQDLLQSYDIKQQDLNLIHNQQKQARQMSLALVQNPKSEGKSNPAFKKNKKQQPILTNQQQQQKNCDINPPKGTNQ